MTDNEKIGNRIKQRREELDLTQEDLGNQLSMNKSTIQRYETGQIKRLKLPVLQAIAYALQVSPEWLTLKTNEMTVHKKKELLSPILSDDTVTFQVIGDLAAGYEHLAVEDWRGESVEIPTSYLKGHNKNDFVVLSVKGDSMYPLYHDGDKVLILKQNYIPYSGAVGAVFYRDEFATLKKVEYGDGFVKLWPINPNVPKTIIKGEDLDHFSIFGIPKLLIREIDEIE